MKLKRWLFLAHRYLGIALGLLMLAWCLSGVVMMYVSYPSLAEAERLRHLAPIDWQGCCAPLGTVLADDAAVDRFRVEMLADRPVLRLRPQDRPPVLIDLLDGTVLGGIDDGQADSVARRYGIPAASERIDDDQWTVSGEFRADRSAVAHRSGRAGRAAALCVGPNRQGRAADQRRPALLELARCHSTLALFH
ncbi:MAG: hypothetical protein WDN69_18675, partial [Aliidongia sp.]